MKSVLCGAAAFFLSLTLFSYAAAADIPWTTDLDAALDRAAKENLTVLALFTGSDWCPYCEKLDRGLVRTGEFSDFVGTGIIPVFIDFPKKKILPEEQARKNREWKKRYAVEGYPTMLLIGNDGKILGTVEYTGGSSASYIRDLREITRKRR
jgi:thioredoxin-related protein